MYRRPLVVIVLSLFAAFPPALWADDAAPGTPPVAITADGGRYWGPLVQGVRHGQGRIEWANGSSYVGGFVDGLFSGHGVLRNADGEVAEGQFAAGSMNGPGRLVLVDGSVLEGQFVDGHLNGEGRYQGVDGSIYEGGFRNDRYEGQGHLRTAAMEYQGEFHQGTFAGQGELHRNGGVTYRGQFADGDFSGQGVYTIPNGPVYEGEFVAGKFTGEGVVTYPNGARHSGRFVDWQAQGPGSLTNREGVVYAGEFKNGQLSGEATVSAPDGAHYRGALKNWLPHGQGELQLANGDRYQGGFRNGEYDGQGTLTRAQPGDGERKEDSGIWQFGRLQEEIEAEQQRTQANSERALYTQVSLLDQAIAALQPHTDNGIQLYLLAIAGDGSQEVFRREVDFVGQQFDERFGTRGRSLLLVNSRNTVGERPLATVTAIRQAIAGIAARMDRERDILFLYLTSHGSRQGVLSLALAGVDLPGLSADDLAAMLRESGIRWKVVVVSACYAGNFLAPLRDQGTLAITAARADRTSFGCADENDFTYFGRAFFKEAIPATRSFEDAFRRASELVATWEARDRENDQATAGPNKVQAETAEDRRSLPQIEAPAPIRRQLKAWQTQRARQAASGRESERR